MSLDVPLRASSTGAAISPIDEIGTEALLGHLEARLRAATASCAKVAELVSVTLSVPQFGTIGEYPTPGTAVCWADATSGRKRMAGGVAACLEAEGPRRYSVVDRNLEVLRMGWLRLEPDGEPMPAEAFVGFAFRDRSGGHTGLPAVRLLVPAVLAEWRHQGCIISFSAPWGPSTDAGKVVASWVKRVREWLKVSSGPGATHHLASDPRPVTTSLDRSAWVERVGGALRYIASGHAQKLVLARSTGVRAARAFDLHRVWRRLETCYPACVRFAVQVPGGWLVGASPERLLALEGKRVRADALAGTAQRHPDPARDRREALDLLVDPKIAHEHELVVQALTGALAPLCADLEIPHAPQLLTLSNVHHLWTPIAGRLRRPVSLLDLAGRIYPTPSVSGWPVEAACRWIRDHEGLDRGWYTGAAGWVEGDGGELDLVLRSAVIRGDQAEVYAGAGIVSGSDPDQEFDETEWKLNAMLDALSHA